MGEPMAIPFVDLKYLTLSSSRVNEPKNKQHGRKYGDTYKHSGSGSWMDRKDSMPNRANVGGASVYSCRPIEGCC